VTDLIAAEMARLVEERQAQRDQVSRLREENRTLRTDYDDLHMKHEDELLSNAGWKKERARLESQVVDLQQARDVSLAAQTEQQSQIVALHSQVRELRTVLDEAEADRQLLQKARRALQAELEGIKLDHVDSSRITNATEMQKLQLRKQDLERSVAEYRDREELAVSRLRAAEARASDSVQELGRVRVEATELEKQNVSALSLYEISYSRCISLPLGTRSRRFNHE
jgi:myosin protein heavy chain